MSRLCRRFYPMWLSRRHTMKELVFLCIISSAFIVTSGDFIITPRSNLTQISGDAARFYFLLDPWPIPCHPWCSADYEYVTFEFRNRTHKNNDILCTVRYINATYDNMTEDCSIQNGRMSDFDYTGAVDGVTFEIGSVNYTDRGRYELQIHSNHSMLVQDASSFLTVLVPPPAPDITSNFGYDLIIPEGDNVTLTCKVNQALPPADLRWTMGLWLDLQPVHYEKAAGYDDYTISVINFKAKYSDHGLSYVCWARNEVDEGVEISSSHALNISYVPRVELAPCGPERPIYYVQEYRNLHMLCDVNAFPEEDIVEWFQNDVNDPDSAIEIPTDFFNTTEILLRNLTRHSEKFYWCSAENEIGSSGKRKCEIEVQYGPQIQPLPILEVKQGFQATAECKATGNPNNIHYMWTKVENRTFGIEDAILTIDDVTPEDSGNYTCTATNWLMLGNGDTSTPFSDIINMQLFVKYAPIWREYSLQKFGARVGERVVLSCEVQAYPSVTFTWTFRGNDLVSGGNRNITNGDYQSYLEIRSVQESDRGDYACAVRNTEHINKFQIQLLEPGKPDDPQLCHLHNATDTYVTVVCVPGYAGGEPIGFLVKTKYEGGSKQMVKSRTEPISKTRVYIRIEDLHPGLDYEAYIYGDNIHGKSEEEYTITFRTTGDGEAPPQESPPIELNIAAIIGGSVAAVIAVALLAVLGLYLYWRHDPKESDDEDDDQETTTGCWKTAHPYTVVDSDEYGEDMGWHYNERSKDINKDPQDYDISQLSQEPRRHLAKNNEYIPHPGVTKITKEEMADSRSRTDSDNSIEVMADVHIRPPNGTRPKTKSTHINRDALKKNNKMHQMNGSRHSLNSSQEVLSLPRIPDRNMIADERWEIPRDLLYFRQKLGDGAFGEVWRAVADEIHGRKGSSVVAVKLVKEGCPKEEHVALHKELQVMKMLKPHPNIISLVGCCSTDEPVLIVMEYASRGSLQQYLRDNRADTDSQYGQRNMTSQSLTSHDLIRFALQVACGMEYIATNSFLHRDLAARNVLVDDRTTCKISDFGFARDIVNCREYESKAKRRLPIRWMAPESMFDNIYSTKSDVWSFGILLWEIVTLGSSPYPGMTGSDVMELIQMGYRMDKPKHCSNEMYALMRHCWRQSPNQRPDFVSLRDSLEAIFEMSHDPQNNMNVQQMHENYFDILYNIPGEKC